MNDISIHDYKSIVSQLNLTVRELLYIDPPEILR